MNELIAIVVETKGEVIVSNLHEFRGLVRQALEVIQRNPSTDEEFGQAELDVKALKAAKAQVLEAKAKALADAQQLHELFAAFDSTCEEIDAARLELERQINKRKDEVKATLVEEALALLEIEPERARRHYGSKLVEAMKGKRTLATMRQALHIYASTQAAVIRRSREIIAQFTEAHGTTLVPDRLDLELKNPETVAADLQRRLEIAGLERERKALQAEQAAKHSVPPAPTTMPAPMPMAAAPGNRISATEELAVFKKTVVASFAGLRAAKASLRHDEVKETVERFSAAVNQAYLAMEITQQLEEAIA